MSDGVWSTDADGETVRTSDKIQCLVTLGAIHKVPEDESTCVTRGCLKYTDNEFPGAFLSDEGMKYVTAGGASVFNDLHTERCDGSAARVACNSYEAVAGKGDVIGDGVVPFEWTKLEGAKHVELQGVAHSINEVGTTIATNRWYGSENVIDRWLPFVLEKRLVYRREKGRVGRTVILRFHTEEFQICRGEDLFLPFAIPAFPRPSQVFLITLDCVSFF